MTDTTRELRLSIHEISRLSMLPRLPGLATNFIAGLRSARDDWGDCLSTKLPYPALWLFHPSCVQSVLDDESAHFKKSDNYRLLRSLLGESVITTDGEKWRKQRRSVAPLFHGAAIQEFLPSAQTITERLLEDARKKDSIFLHSMLCEWSLAVASKCFFDSPFPLGADRVSRLFDRGARSLFFKTVFRLKGPLAKAVPWTREYDEGLKLIDSWVRDLVKKRQLEAEQASLKKLEDKESKPENKKDILRQLLKDSDAQELRDQCVSILMAGHDTTALTLFWTLHLLFQNPKARATCRDEIRALFTGRPIDAQGIASMKYTEQVLFESMRLYPVVNTLSREALDTTSFHGIEIAKGTLVQFAPFVTHRHPDAWKDPDRFEPSRFSLGNLALIPSGAYFPFGLGPRECVGQGFAMQQMKVFLAHLFNFYEIEVPADQMPNPRPFLTLRPSQDTPVKIRKK